MSYFTADEDLFLVIDAAFPARGDKLAASAADEDDWDSDCIDEDFAFKSRGEISDEVLLRHEKSLPGFNAEAFVFFLPKFLSMALRYPDSELAQHLIYRFSSLDLECQWWSERLRLMNSEQLIAVRAVIMALGDSSESEFIKSEAEEAAARICFALASNALGSSRS